MWEREPDACRTALLSARDVKVHLRVHRRIVKAVDGVDLDVIPANASASWANPAQARARWGGR